MSTITRPPSHNVIHRCQQVAIIYQLTKNIIMNNIVAHCQFIMTRIMLFSYIYARLKIDEAVRCRSHRPVPVRQVQGYHRCHWTPPLGNFLHRIAPANTMVINFGVKKQVVAFVKSLSEASIQKAQNRPSNQLIKATSCVDRLNAMMKAEELS